MQSAHLGVDDPHAPADISIKDCNAGFLLCAPDAAARRDRARVAGLLVGCFGRHGTHGGGRKIDWPVIWVHEFMICVSVLDARIMWRVARLQ